MQVIVFILQSRRTYANNILVLNLSGFQDLIYFDNRVNEHVSAKRVQQLLSPLCLGINRLYMHPCICGNRNPGKAG